MKLAKYISQIFYPLSNCSSVTLAICQELGVLFTRTGIKKEIEEHPNYPSLLSISDILNSYGIQNVSIKINKDKFSTLSFPVIVQIKDSVTRLENFTVVKKISNSNVIFLDHTSRSYKSRNIDEFINDLTGITLIAVADENSKEPSYENNLKNENRGKILIGLSVLIIPLITIFSSLFTYIEYGPASLYAIFYAFLSFFGVAVGSVLSWYELDSNNSTLKKICTLGKKTDCQAILNSKASKIWGISWTVVGFTFFLGNLISLLIVGIYDLNVLFLLACFNALALPYVVFSLYYQSKIAKQWCVLCLITQAILVTQFIVAISGGFYFMPHFDISTLYVVLVSFVIPFVSISLLMKFLYKYKNSKEGYKNLQRLKHNSKIFYTLLSKQPKISENTDGLGIYIGNPDAKNKLLKICNPHCGPCATSHHLMEALLENNDDLQIQIIFTSNNSIKDLNTPVINHFLSVYDQGNESKTKKALSDWYASKVKDYNLFAKNQLLMDKNDLDKQLSKTILMREWCDRNTVSFTPCFYLNGYQLPEMYTVADLKYFLLV